MTPLLAKEKSAETLVRLIRWSAPIRGRHGAAIGDGRRRTDRLFEQKHRIIGRNRAAIIQRDGGYICAIAFQVNRPIANRLNGACRGVCQADGIIANIGNANGVIAFDPAAIDVASVPTLIEPLLFKVKLADRRPKILPLRYWHRHWLKHCRPN